MEFIYLKKNQQKKKVQVLWAISCFIHYNLFSLVQKIIKLIIQLQQKISLKMDKENKSISKIPLTQSRKNHQHFNSREQLKSGRPDPLISVIEDEINNNRECNLLQVILTDPLLKELNLSLEKEAEQKKKAKLLENFPFRYRNLVHTEMLYKKLQDQMKENQFEFKKIIINQQRQKQIIQDEVESLKIQINSKEKEKIEEIQQQKILQSNLITQYQSKLNIKDNEICQLTKTLIQISGKMVKVKKQKQNLIEYLDQIKEQAQDLKKQNNRIVQALTGYELDINNLNKIIADQDISLRMSKESLINKITDMQMEYENNIKSKQKECRDLISELEKCKIKIKNYQQQRNKREHQYQQIDIQKYNQIQQTRMRLLEELKIKNCLEEDLQRTREQFLIEIQELEKKNQELTYEIQNINLALIQKNEYYQKEIKKIAQNANTQIKKNIEMIEKQQLNINALNQQQLRLQETILKLKIENQTVTNTKKQLQDLVKQQQGRFQNYIVSTNKRQTKNAEVNILVNQFKGQLSKFNEIITQKQLKIQQYRQDILSLRAKNSEILKERQKILKQSHQMLQKLSLTNYQKDDLQKEILQLKEQIAILSEQFRQNYQLSSKNTIQFSTQYEIAEGENELNQHQLVENNLSKMTLRYQNVFQQLRQFKKQYQEQIQNKEALIYNLQRENMTMKELINNKMFESNDIQKILDSKIKDLKIFYEGKIEQQSYKYKTVISILRQEMTELNQELNIKKSIEEQVYQQIIKINSSRVSSIEQ